MNAAATRGSLLAALSCLALSCATAGAQSDEAQRFYYFFESGGTAGLYAIDTKEFRSEPVQTPLRVGWISYDGVTNRVFVESMEPRGGDAIVDLQDGTMKVVQWVAEIGLVGRRFPFDCPYRASPNRKFRIVAGGRFEELGIVATAGGLVRSVDNLRGAVAGWLTDDLLLLTDGKVHEIVDLRTNERATRDGFAVGVAYGGGQYFYLKDETGVLYDVATEKEVRVYPFGIGAYFLIGGYVIVQETPVWFPSHLLIADAATGRVLFEQEFNGRMVFLGLH